jgi:glycosyltransferase involved in cell wall biosynthesis
MTPVLSVVIPAYNVGRYIAVAVASALDQTLAEIEVIVVDDGSTDDTHVILERFTDPRLRILRKPNGGLSSARNVGVAAATGRYIGFLDGDDAWRPGKAMRQVSALHAEPGVGITYSHSAYMDVEGRETGRLLVSGPDRPSLRDMILRNRVGNGSTAVVRTEALLAAGPFDERLRSCEDWEMWVRILRDTRTTALLVPEVLTLYRINPSGLSMDFSGFLHGAEAAAARIAAETPEVSPALVRRGLAMSYRIAATKALHGGSRRICATLLMRAVALCPWLPLTDPRLLPTAALLAVPGLLISVLHKNAAIIQTKGSAHVPGSLERSRESNHARR